MSKPTSEVPGKNHTKTAQKQQKKESPPPPPPPPPAESATSPASQVRQATFLKEMAANRFNISVACEKTGIARRTFYWWSENNPEFKARYDDLLESRLDKWEDCLHKNILAGSETSVIFALKTKGKKRGYVEKETQDERVVEILAQVLAEELTVREAAYKITMLGFPLPEVIKIQLAKATQEEEEDTTPSTPPADLDKAYQEAIAHMEAQVETFLPERQADVLNIKDDLKAQESFAPGQEAADSPQESF